MSARAGRTLRILLAEDNLINQRVAVTLLGNRGHEVVVVENGKDAVAAALAEKFDAVLMDVQMPEMDGFEATMSIRAAEVRTGGHVPIIAMTAHAMKGDRERCLAAGMDSYMSKPIDVDRFLELVEAHGAGMLRGGSIARASSGGEPSFDLDATLARLDGSVELVREVATLFRGQAIERMEGLRAAVERSDVAMLGRLSHALKGEAAMLGVDGLAHAAGTIERAVREDDLTEIRSLFETLESDMAHFLTTLDAALERLEPATSRSQSRV